MFRNAAQDANAKSERKRLKALRFDLMTQLANEREEIHSLERQMDRIRIDQLMVTRTDELNNFNDLNLAIIHLDKKIEAQTKVIDEEKKWASRGRTMRYIGGAVFTAASMILLVLCISPVLAPTLAVMAVTSAVLFKVGMAALCISPFLGIFTMFYAADALHSRHQAQIDKLVTAKDKLVQLRNYLVASNQEIRQLRRRKGEKEIDAVRCERKLAQTVSLIEQSYKNEEANPANAQPSLAGSMHGLHAARRPVEPAEQQEAIVPSRRQSFS